jgi:hypothetical protein
VLKHLTTFCLLSLVLFWSRVTLALAPADLGAIGDFRTFTHNIEGSSKKDNLNLKFNELELAIQGYLNPYARADVFVSSGGDNFEIEEASATILRGLPANLNIKVGQYLVDFGKLNQGHPHAWSFVDRPISHRMLLGADGLKDVGIGVSTLLPIGVYSKLSLNILSGQPLAWEGEERGTEKPMGVGRWSMFLPVSEHGNMDAGISGLFGTYLGKDAEKSRGHNLKATMAAVDFKYKCRPSDYSSLVLQGEWLFNRREQIREDAVKTVSNSGGFAFVDYGFHKRFNVGMLVDYAPGVFDYQADDLYETGAEENNNTPLGRFDNKNSTLSLTGFVGFGLVEETTLIRLYGRYMKFNISDGSLLADPEMTSKKSQFLLGLQILFTMGPHKPHEF